MSIAEVPTTKAIPASARFDLKPSAVPAKRTRINIQPYQAPTGNITSSQLIQFYIPSRRGTMYDPSTLYLRGTITGVTSANNRALLNRNAFSLFNRLQVYGQDSTLLEDIQNYNDLCHVLMDVQMSREDKYALSTMYAGSDSSVTTTFAAELPATGVPVVARTNAGAPINPVDAAALLALFTGGNRIGRMGGIANGAADAAVALTVNPATTSLIDNGVRFTNAASSLDFCIPVVSAFGLLGEKMIPTGWLNSDLRMDFYTELPNVAFRAHDAAFANPEAVTQYQLTGLELVVDMIEFDSEGMAIITQFAPPTGPLYLHATTYKSYTSTLANGTVGFYSQLLPHRSLSVKQVLSSTHIANADGFDSFARVLPYGSANLQAGLNIGGAKFPQKPISNPAELFAELQKSQHAFNSLLLNGSISRSEYIKYAADNGGVQAALSCKPVIGFDTELYDKKGATIINGQNWTGLNVFSEGNVARNAAGAALLAVLTTNTFVNFDVIFVVQDGVLSVRF